MDTVEPVIIRKFMPNDRGRLRSISCDTALQGIDRKKVFSDDEILADALTMYYTDYEPQSCFVAAVQNLVVGYVVGTTNVSVMEHISNAKIFPRIFAKAMRKGVFFNSVNLKFFFYLMKSAAKGEFFMPSFSKEFPAMLHINIDSSYRRQGIGERLIEAYMEYLKSLNVRGVHFGTFSESAKYFFIQMGFIILHQGKRTYFKPYTDKEVNFYVFGKQL